MRLFFRFLSLVSLAVAVLAAVVDVARSLSAEVLVLTPLLRGWNEVSPASLTWLQGVIQTSLPGFVWDPVFVFLLAMPAAAVFCVLAALFYAAGAKREKPFGQIRTR